MPEAVYAARHFACGKEPRDGFSPRIEYTGLRVDHETAGRMVTGRNDFERIKGGSGE